MRRVPTLFCAMVLLGAAGLADTLPEPRPISDAERAAVQVAASFLTQGPQAFAGSLSPKSPLRRPTMQQTLDEIEARTGPPDSATWRLETVLPSEKDRMAVFEISYPSGFTENLIVELQREGSVYTIENLRILAEPSPRPGVRQAVASKPGEQKRLSSLSVVQPLLVLAGAALAFFAALSRRMTRAWSRAALAGSAVILILAFGLPLMKRTPPAVRTPAGRVPEADAGLAPLVGMRRQMASGETDLRKVTPPKNPCALQVARLWQAEAALQEHDYAFVRRILRDYETPAAIPLVEIIRARMAVAELREVDAVLAYERAISLGPGRDALWWEVASNLYALGFEDRAETYLARMPKIGSREAEIYYTLAMLHASHNQSARAERVLLTAWNLQPDERANLISAGFFSDMLRREPMGPLLRLNDSAEPVFADSEMSSRPITLPPGTTGEVSGRFFHAVAGDRDLFVPGGAVLAPTGTQLVDAAVWRKTSEAKALRDVSRLQRLVTSGGALTQPVVRRRLEATVEALGAHSRWQELIALTQPFTAATENVPPSVLLWRGIALRKSGAVDQARTVFAAMAASPSLRRRNDPQLTLSLAEMLASVDLFDASVKLFERAAAIRENPMIDDRIRQIRMNQRLATRYQSYSTPHFEIHYSASEVSESLPAQIGDVLESELQRLGRILPAQNFHKVTVNVVSWEEFRSTYTGSDHILGFYDGKLTIPFAGVTAFPPEIVAILTHELTHAIIAQATADQAPHWFQEGVAQRFEMIKYAPNAFNMYPDDRLLSFRLIESVLESSPDADSVGQAYVESQTMIRFIEATRGRAALAGLLAAFREGLTTEDAVERVFNTPLSSLDAAFRAWGRAEERVFENPEPQRFDLSPAAAAWSKPERNGGREVTYAGGTR